MAQPAMLLASSPVAARRADGHAVPLLSAAAFALNGSAAARGETWRPAKSVLYVFATCGALWAGAIFAYLTFH